MGRCGRWLLAFLACLLGAPAWSQDDIVDVLRRSQDQRLQAQPLADADSTSAATVRRSFDSLLQALQPAPSVELRVTQGALLAETLHGHIIVAHQDLAAMPEAARLFVLAHELGHVVQQHWLRTALLYQQWVPGVVTPATTEPVAGRLARAASAQAHDHEFAADAFAAQLLRRLGRSDDELLAVFRHLAAVTGSTGDTASHPGTRKRIAQLRALVGTDVRPSHGTSSSMH